VGAWTYDGASWQKVQGPQPPPREDAQMAYDDNRNVVVLFGGKNVVDGSTFSDTWEWNGTWTQRVASGPDPRSRGLLSASPDGDVILVGGTDDAQNFHDVWRYDGQWTLLAPNPFARSQPRLGALVPSPAGGLVFVTENTNDGRQETWQRQDGLWSFVGDTAPNAPAVRDNATVAFDSNRNVVVLSFGFIGSSVMNDVWEMNASHVWTQRFTDAPQAGRPSQRQGTTAIFDPFSNKLMVLSGVDNNGNLIDDAWLYDGAWAPLPGAHPRPRQFASVAFDPGLNQIVLYGGQDQSGRPLGDTWLRDASGWHEDFPSTSPPVRAGAGAAYSSDLGGIVLFGGEGADSLLSQTWLFRDDSWQMQPQNDVAGDGEPNASAPWQQAAFDAQSNEIVVKSDDDEFAFAGPGDHPGFVFHVAASSALAKPGSITTSIEVRANAGGTASSSTTAGSTQNGVLVRVWDGAQFVDAGTSTASAQSLTLVDGFAPATSLLGAVGGDQHIHVAVAALGDTGDTGASVSLDALSVRYGYREP
jgi:hypothetical protein